MEISEKDYRLNILNGLLKTPHRDLTKIAKTHADVLKNDPYFYGRLGYWYCSEGQVRDHKEVFIAHMLVSGDTDHREAGCVLLQQLPPYQVVRVIKFMKTQFRKVPRSARTAIVEYLRKREASNEHFDSAAVRQRKAMKTLYASLRVRPSERANKILFENNPPDGSMARVVKDLAKINEPIEQAKILVGNAVPYPIAVGIIKKMTPTVLVALINAMTPAEVINNVSSLKKRGAMDHPQIKKLINAKLKDAQKDKRVSAYKAKVAAEVGNADAETIVNLAKVTDEQIKRSKRVGKRTALLIDKSGSMSQAIEVGKQLAALISAACENDFYCYAFDTIPIQLEAKGGTDVSHWEDAAKGIRAGGGTCIGGPLKVMRQRGQMVEQFIIVTDEHENTPPFFTNEWTAYSNAFGVEPNVVIVRVGSWATWLENGCKTAGIPVDTMKFEGDYYSLPNILPLLARPSRMDLLMEILALELPKRVRKQQQLTAVR